MSIHNDFVIPELTTPFQALTHPAEKESRRLLIEWLARVGFSSKPEQEENINAFSGLNASIFPIGEDPERLALAAQATHFSEVIDDHFMERPIRAGHLNISADHVMKVFEISDDPYRDVPDKVPLYTAWQDLCQRMVDLAGWEELERFSLGMQTFAFGCLLEMAYTTTDTLPSFGAYGPLRQRTTGFYPWFNDQMIGFVAGRHIPASTLAQPEVRKMRKMSAQIIGYYNDICAFKAEPAPERAMALPAVLARECGCSLQDGLYAAHDVWNSLVLEFATLTDECQNADSEHVRFLAQAATHMVAGFMHWGNVLTQRYESTDSTRWTDTQHDVTVYQQD